jgi:cytochrome c
MRKARYCSGLIPALVSASFAVVTVGMAQDGDVGRGANLFRKRCAGCHVNQGNDGRGPNLTDIVGGRPAAEGFNYSSSIRFASWIWTVERLDNYLKNPSAVVAGATTASIVRNEKDRAEIIAYLNTLHSPPGAPKYR